MSQQHQCRLFGPFATRRRRLNCYSPSLSLCIYMCRLHSVREPIHIAQDVATPSRKTVCTQTHIQSRIIIQGGDVCQQKGEGLNLGLCDTIHTFTKGAGCASAKSRNNASPTSNNLRSSRVQRTTVIPQAQHTKLDTHIQTHTLKTPCEV